MKRYDAYLFDMDGTVCQTFVPWMDIVVATLETYSITADKKIIIRKIFGDARRGLVEMGIPEQDLPTVFVEWDKLAAESMQHVELYPHIAEVLAELKKNGKKLALITATVRPTVEIILAAHSLQDTFDVVVTGDELHEPKPDPEGILFALDKMGIDRAQAVMLGDSEKDIRAAHNAGTDSVLFFPPEHESFHTFAELQADRPTYTISSWQQLLSALE